MKKLENVAEKFLAAVGSILLLVLTGYSLFYTEWFENNHQDMPVEMHDNWKMMFLLMLLIVLFLGLCSKFVGGRISGWLCAGTILIMGAIAVWWIGIAKTDIVGDQRSLYYLAHELLNGELTETERIYLQMYPHQAGMVLLMEAVLLLAGGNYMAFKYVNVLGMAGCVAAGYLLIRELTDREEDTEKTEVLYLLLMLGCLPLYIYCSFNYNDIIALTFGMAACVEFLKFLKTGKKENWLGMTVLLTVAIILRSNFGSGVKIA